MGETYQIVPILKPAESEAEYTFTSQRRSVAEVDGDGLITAIKAGTATVTVRTATREESEYVCDGARRPHRRQAAKRAAGDGVGEMRRIPLLHARQEGQKFGDRNVG